MGVVIHVEKHYPGITGRPAEKGKEKETHAGGCPQAEREEPLAEAPADHPGELQRGGLAPDPEVPAGERPEDHKEAKRHLRKFLNGMRETYRKAGIPFKWIAVTERGRKGRSSITIL